MRVETSEITIAWSHCDARRIVFYPHYYVWFDEATERLFVANGLGYDTLYARYRLAGMPLVETGAKYSAPCKLGDTVHMESWVEEWAGKTLLVKHRISHRDGTVALEGFERRVWAIEDPAAPKGMRAEKVPDEVMALFVD